MVEVLFEYFLRTHVRTCLCAQRAHCPLSTACCYSAATSTAQGVMFGGKSKVDDINVCISGLLSRPSIQPPRTHNRASFPPHHLAQSPPHSTTDLLTFPHHHHHHRRHRHHHHHRHHHCHHRLMPGMHSGLLLELRGAAARQLPHLHKGARDSDGQGRCRRQLDGGYGGVVRL